ncbi:MAG: PKD domain-containing protein [Thermoplasmatota archaeon]
MNRFVLLLLIMIIFSGCVHRTPQEPEPTGESPVPADRTISDPTHPWNATYSIKWTPEAPRAGEQILFQSVLIDGRPPADPRMQWAIGDATWTGRTVPLVLPAGDHEVRLDVAGDGFQVATLATVAVLSDEAAEPGSEGGLEDPGPPVIVLEQDQNEVHLSLNWSAKPSEVRWFLGDESIRTGESVTYLYGAKGTYTIIAHALHGTTRHEARAEVTVAEVPLRASYSFTGDTAAFQSSWGEVPTSVLWEFGDGASSVDTEPTHTYAGPGPWDAKVTVTGASGTEVLPFTVEARTWPITVLTEVQGPRVDFSFEWPWEPAQILWRMDGTTYRDPAPQHGFTSLGIHTVELTLDDGTHRRTELVQVTIERVALAIHATIDGGRVDFDFTWGPDPDSIRWTFGDGATSQEAAPTHTFGARGDFTVTLRVTQGTLLEEVSTTVNIDVVPLVIQATPRLVDGDSSNHVDFAFTWGERVAERVTWDFGDGTSDAMALKHAFRSAGQHVVRLTAHDAEGSAMAQATVDVEVVHPYLFDCPSGWTPGATFNHGTDGDLHWAVLKSGFRMFLAWETSNPEPSRVQYWDGAWREHTSDVDATHHLVFLEGLPEGQDLCFEVDGKAHATHLGNGPTGWDDWDQVYTVNSVNLVNEQSHLPTVQEGIDNYARLLWDATDGHIRAGMNLILANDPQRHNSGWVTCYIVPAGGTPTCNQLHDVIFTFDASPTGAASTYLMGIEDPAAAIWMNWYWQGALFCSHICLDDVGSVLTHEYGHYLLDMLDYYAEQDDPTGQDCTDIGLSLSIMGGSRDVTEFDDVHHPCPNRAQFEKYEPNWERARAHFGHLPDRADGIDPGPEGNGGGYSRVTIDVAQNLA